MVLDEDPVTLQNEIGHDGLGIQYPELKEPLSLRGHHIQEILDCFIKRGKGLMFVEVMPRSGPKGHPELWHTIFNEDVATIRFLALLQGRRAILIGVNPETGGNHAYAWTGHEVYDPIGRVLKISETPVREAWIVVDNVFQEV
jgi:hypothetical protein